MKKITSKQIFIYVSLLGIIAVVAVYMLVFKKYNGLAEETRLNNEALQTRINQLKVHYDNEPNYLTEMEAMAPMVDEILAKYPADILEEDLIMHAVNTKLVTPVKYSNINFGKKGTLKTVDAATVQGAGLEKYQEAISFNQYAVSYPTELTYLGLKNLVQVVFDSDYHIGINNLAFAASGEENGLTGNMDLVFYSATGTGKEYTLPDMTVYEAGVLNIFGLENEEELIVETEENAE